MIEGLRDLVRAAIAESGAPLSTMSDAWMRGHDPAFTKVLAAHHLIGLTWPAELGGRAGSNLDRLVVTEELLRVAAPVAAHWIADRQIGPAVLRHGSPQLQRELLPGIAAGDVTFCLGMSETESGSDLAAVRTRAVRDGDDFRITGAKIWTSHAHRSTHAYVLARTDATGAKHEGLTEFVVDLSSPGVLVRPITDLAGEHHFNETIFDDVAVPAGNVIGTVGGGWEQVTEQLAFERGGMERVLSTYPLLAALLGPGVATDPTALGGLLARLHALRAIAVGVARAMDAGRAPVQQAALLKFLGTAFEADVVDTARDQLDVSPDPSAEGVEGLLARSIAAVPGATIRGGTTEVLLTIVGRQELSPKRPSAAVADERDELRAAIADALHGVRREPDPTALGETWRSAVQLGWTTIGTDDAAGGSGGDVHDLAEVAQGLALAGRCAPVVETAVAAMLLAGAGRTVDPARPLTHALGSGIALTRDAGRIVLDGRQRRVAWGRAADAVVVAAGAGADRVLVLVPADADGVTLSPGTDLAGHPRDTLVLDAVSLPASAVVGDGGSVEAAHRLVGALHSASLLGSLRAAQASVREHVSVREQFGRPLAAFQAVAHSVARLAAEVAAAEAAVGEAVAEAAAGGPGWRVVAGRLVTARAAGAVARTAHQLLGAMGITREHDLHLATLALWSGRDEGTSERALATRLGDAAAAAGPDAAWDWVVHEAAGLGTASAWGER